MRLNNQIIQFLKQTFREKIPEAKVYLFGSRTKDDESGGDIDLMVVTQNHVDKKILRAIRIEFYKRFGWQKIDIVNFTHDDQSLFRQLIKPNAIEL